MRIISILCALMLCAPIVRANDGVADAASAFSKVIEATALFRSESTPVLTEALRTLIQTLPQTLTRAHIGEVHKAMLGAVERIERTIPKTTTRPMLDVGATHAVLIMDQMIGCYRRAAPADVEPLWQQWIDTVAAVKKKLAGSDRAGKMMDGALGAMAEHVVREQATLLVKANVGANAVTAVVQDVQDVASRARDIAQGAQTKMTVRGFERYVSSMVSIRTEERGAAYELLLPYDALLTMEKNNVDGFEWKTPIGTVALLPYINRKLPNSGTALVIRIERFVWDEGRRNTLMEKQKSAVDVGDLGYHVTLFAQISRETRQLMTNLEDPFIVRIPYALRARDDADVLTALQMGADGAVMNKVGRYEHRSEELTFFSRSFEQVVIKVLNPLFKDVSQSFWGHPFVTSLAAKGIVLGRPNGTFDPKGLVTRAEFAKMIVLLLGLQEQTIGKKPLFFDVSSKSWYAPYVYAASHSELINGYPNGQFRPKANITREEMSVIVARVLGLKPPPRISDVITFADRDKIAVFARNSVGAMVAAGLMNGKTPKLFKPKDKATRTEAAALMYTISKYIAM